MRYTGRLGLAGAVLLAFAAARCGGGGSSSANPPPSNPPPSNVSVTVSPASSTVGFGAAQQFKATVTGASNSAVTWSVSSSASSSSSQVGSISSSGLYTAPAASSSAPINTAQPVSVAAGGTAQNVDISVPPLNSVDSVTVTATSQADSSKSASATVTLTGLSILAVGQCTHTTATQLSCSAGSTGTEISQGQNVLLFVAGFGIVPGTNYCISGMGTDCTGGSGTDVVVTPPLDNQFQTASDGTPVVYFQVSVLPGAALGPRNLVVRNSGNELTSFAGAVDITP